MSSISADVQKPCGAESAQIPESWCTREKGHPGNHVDDRAPGLRMWPQQKWQPLSVRNSRRISKARFVWWLKGRRSALALKIAPWLGGPHGRV